MNDSLDGALRTAASTIDIPPGDFDRVVSRGAARMRRNKRLARGSTTLVVILSLLAAVNVAGRRDDSVPMRVASAGAQRGDIAIDWARQDAPALGSIASIEEVSGTLYTLSTAPGETALNGRGIVWHSSNGLDWSPRDRPGDLYLADLSARGNRLYAVGTTPGTARTPQGKEVPDQIVAWSDDGAQTWQQARLPIETEEIAARSKTVITFPGQVATSARGVVAVTKTMADPDASLLLPRGTEAPNGWVAGPTGIDILESGPPQCPSGTEPPPDDLSVTFRAPSGRVTGVPCGRPQVMDGGVGWDNVGVSPQEVYGVAASYTWDDLDVGADLRRAILGMPMLSRAGDDGTFAPVEDVMPDDTWGVRVVPAPDGTFVLFTNTPAGVQVSTSTDGASWQSALPVSHLETVHSAGWVGDRLALLGPTGGQSALGLVVGLPAEGWRHVDLPEIAGIDGSAPELASWGVLSLTASSGVAITISELDGDGNLDRSQLLVSRDGATWSVTSLDELVGAPIEHASAIATPRGPMVSAVLEGSQDNKSARRVLLMGTYR